MNGLVAHLGAGALATVAAGGWWAAGAGNVRAHHGSRSGAGSDRRGEWPSAGRWSRRRDLRALAVPGASGGRLVLGRAGRHGLVATEQRHSLLVVGPTQTHKTSGLAIPALLEWDGPVLAASVKDDLIAHTLEHRSRLGESWIYDPTASTRHGSDGWSPLGTCHHWTGARRAASSLAAFGGRGGMEDGQFWYAAAARLIAPLLFAASVAGASMSDVVRWVDTHETVEVEEILVMAGCPEALNAARASWGREERQRSSVYTTAETVLEAFADPEVGYVAAGSGIDAHRLLDGGANTVWICAPAHEQERLRPLFCSLVEEIVNAAFDLARRSGGPLDPPLLVVLDEAANIAPLRYLDTLASTAASHGIQLVTIWQDFAQLRARYGERSSTLVNNHRARMFLSGLSDGPTLDYLSHMVGDALAERASTTRDPQGRRSSTWQPAREPLAPPAWLRQIPPGEGVLLYGHLPPVKVTLRPFFDDPELSRRAGPELSRRADPELSRRAGPELSRRADPVRPARTALSAARDARARRRARDRGARPPRGDAR